MNLPTFFNRHLTVMAAIFIFLGSSGCRWSLGVGSSSHLTMDHPKASTIGESSWIKDTRRLPSDQEIASHIEGKKTAYYMVTEFDPRVLREHLQKLQKKTEVQIVVGTERGFLTSVAEYLILADNNPFIHLYNHINISLLKLSTDHETYLKLRFAQSFDVWKSFFQNKNSDYGLNKKIYFEFWKYAQDKTENKTLNAGTINMQNYFKKEGLKSTASLFPLEDHYIENPILFDHLKKLADQNRIVIRDLDFTQPSQVKTLKDELTQKGQKIGIVDVSNIYQYIKDQGILENYITSLSYLSQAHLVMTFLNPKFARVTLNGKKFFKFFHYYVLDPGVSIRKFFGKPIDFKSLGIEQILISVPRPPC